MKKKLLIISIAILALFVMGGCKKITTPGKETFMEMEYDLPEGYTNKEEYKIGADNITRNYWYSEGGKKGVQLFYYKDTDYSLVLDDSDSFEEKVFNGTTWRKTNETLAGLNYDSYATVYGNDLYVIELDSIDKYPELSKFMDGVKFN